MTDDIKLELVPGLDEGAPKERHPKYDDIMEKLAKKNELKKKLKELFPEHEEDEWTIVQQMFQEVMSTWVVENPDKSIPAAKQFLVDYKELVKAKYSEEPEKQELLLELTPSLAGLKLWVLKKGWDDAVWATFKTTKMFTPEKKAKLLDSLWKRGCDKDTNAAKIWLTISGDYVDKVDLKKDDTAEKYREINKILHKK
jgi:hypothetical protein